MIRDHALFVGGLLNERIGGSSVKPFQPPGLWKQLTNRREYQQIYLPDDPPESYRRSLYVYWKRAAHHPVMSLFDAPSREVCTVRRPRTNTPLQALALLNEPQFFEAAMGLARRMLTEPAFGNSAQTRIPDAFQLATGRKPTEPELKALLELLRDERAELSGRPGDVSALLGADRISDIQAPEFAAYLTVSRAILNLGATITRD